MTPAAAHRTSALPSPERRRALATATARLEASLPGGRLVPAAGVEVLLRASPVPLLVALAWRVHTDREAQHGGGVALLRLEVDGSAWWALLTASQRKAFLFSASGRLCALGDLVGPRWGSPAWRTGVEHHHWY